MSTYTVIYASPAAVVGTRGQVGIRVEATSRREAVALANPRRDALGGFRAAYVLSGVTLDGQWVSPREA